MTIKIDKRMIWSIIGLLIFGIFGVASFEGIGYAVNGISLKLHTLSNFTSNTSTENIYGTAIAGIVLAWIAIVMPLFSLLVVNKCNKYIGSVAILFATAALALMIGSEATFVTLPNMTGLDHGREAGVFILVIVGGLFGMWTSVYSYLPSFKNEK